MELRLEPVLKPVGVVPEGSPTRESSQTISINAAGKPEKRCTKCQQWLPTQRFHANSKCRTGLTSWCKACVVAGKRQSRQAKSAAREVAPRPVVARPNPVKRAGPFGQTTRETETGGTEKWCPRGRHWAALTAEHFNPVLSTRTGFSHYCRACNAQAGRERRDQLRPLVDRFRRAVRSKTEDTLLETAVALAKGELPHFVVTSSRAVIPDYVPVLPDPVCLSGGEAKQDRRFSRFLGRRP